jgi:hypothetical protein
MSYIQEGEVIRKLHYNVLTHVHDQRTQFNLYLVHVLCNYIYI